jgi:O-antigen/teichoic acid export membrane protein
MNYKSLARNAGTAFLAQGVAMLLSILQTLLVPKLLGTTEYGYWQLFIFYQSYVGFAHFGLNDGVYLINGGKSRDIIDKKNVNSQFAFSICFELVIAAVIVVIACFGGFGADREFVIACTGIFLVIQNAAMYLSYLFQAMNETRKSSYSSIVERLSFLVPLLVLLVGHCQSFRPFVIAYIFSSICQLVYCSWHYRDFFRSGFLFPTRAIAESFASIRVGFKLMMANIASSLILGIVRFAIDTTWGIDTFGQLSFALSMVNFFFAFINQASMVLFPALRQSTATEIKSFFVNARDIMSLTFPVVYILYFPMVWLLDLWLPKYASSFIFFIFLIPLCVFDSKMSICCGTFFKVLRKEGKLLRVNLWACAASALITALGIYVFQSIFFIIGGVVIAIIGRSLWSERYIARYLEVGDNRDLTVGEFLLTGVFVSMALLLPRTIAMIVYTCAYAVFLACFRQKARVLLAKANRLALKD